MERVNETREIAIKLSGVKKKYRLGQIGGTTLRADLQSWWAKIRKREDPNVRVGVDQRLLGREFMALNGIDLTIYQGEVIGIIGGNGAGKSTMLKLLSRVTAPTEGEIDIYGRIASMLEVGTGFNPEMTGRENVYLNGAILGMTKAEIDAKMEDIIEFSEVRDFIDTPVKRYSSGMYVKLAFSVAAHLDSEIMIMDEVLAVGDVNYQQKCLKKMREAAKQEGRTVLYVSHNMNTIRQLCDRCVVLSQGKVIFEGDVEEAIEVYNSSQKIDLLTTVDLSTKKRNGSFTTQHQVREVCLNTLYVNDKKELEFCLKIHSTHENDNMIIRAIINTTSGVVVGMTYSELIKFGEGENDIHLSFDSRNLAAGAYIVDLAIMEWKNELQVRHDSIPRAFAFNVEENDLQYGMKWNRMYFGAMKLATLKERKQD